MRDVYDWEFNQHESAPAFITSDNPALLPVLETQHRFFVDNYLDDIEYFQLRLKHYQTALASLCECKKIRYIEFDIYDIPGAWLRDMDPGNAVIQAGGSIDPGPLAPM